MKANEVIRKVLDEHGEITEVYWVACGGSLIDLYPSHFLMNVESAKTSSGWHTAKEFLVATPKKLGKHSLVVMCSHSGNTKEAVDAAVLAYERGAAVVTLTDNAGSKADDPRFIAWVYPWGDGVPTSEVPLGICPMLAAELIKAQEGFEKYDALVDGLAKMDGISESECRAGRKICRPVRREQVLLHSGLWRQLQPDLWICHLQPDGDAVAALQLHPFR